MRSVISSSGLALLAILGSTWALWFWLSRLTAFARAFSSGDLSVERFETSLKEIRARQAWLGKVWLIGSIYILIPAILLSVIIVITELSSMFAKVSSFPAWVNPILFALSIGLSLIVGAYTLCLLAVSSGSDNGAGKTATQAFMLCLRKPLEILGASFCVMLFNCLIDAPDLLLSLSQAGMSPEALPFAVAGNIWMGITSLVAWPMSVAILCQSVANAGNEHQLSRDSE